MSISNDKDFIGNSPELNRIRHMVDKLSPVDTAVLIRGESGTGKELIARSLHRNSPRKENRFVSINCTAIPENLIESELFGYEKGAFTGAESRKIGKFQYADGGTLFLDEIGDISPAMQVKLLRVLQDQRFTPIGSNEEVSVRVRIVTATNRDLESFIKKGLFREDLFYRLNVFPIHLPPLRDRKGDLGALCEHLISKLNKKHNKIIIGISDACHELLKSYTWPGNIRELENVLEHAMIIEPSFIITPASLPEIFNTLRSLQIIYPSVVSTMTTTKNLKNPNLFEEKSGFRLECQQLDFQKNKRDFEKTFLLTAMKTFHGRINQTAIQANIPKKTLLRKLLKYKINAGDFFSN